MAIPAKTAIIRRQNIFMNPARFQTGYLLGFLLFLFFINGCRTIGCHPLIFGSIFSPFFCGLYRPHVLFISLLYSVQNITLLYMRSQHLTTSMVKSLNLPDKPGVYIFRDQRGRPLYIGRATSLRDRVKSYFGNDLIETRGPRIVDMVTRAAKLTHEVTDSVLEAIILESNLIKRYQPKYNVDERDDKSDLYIIITKESWPRVFTARVRDWKSDSEKGKSQGEIKAQGAKVFGPYPHAGLVNESLKILRKIFPFKDKKSHDPRHEAFYKAIGRSPAGDSDKVSVGKSTAGVIDSPACRQYRNTIRNLKLFLGGKKTALVRHLERDMEAYAKNMQFEEAGAIKRTLYALKHINDIALIKKSLTDKFTSNGTSVQAKYFRMEAYDIAHLSGTNTVGAMVVSVNSEYQSKDFRTFKISHDMNNDIANLVELVSRRLNHPEWAFPDLIVVDGNKNQKRAVEAVLSARRINIPVVAVVKDDKHKARAILGLENKNPGNPDNSYRSQPRDILALNAEAHRFVLAYHRRRRKIVR